MTTPEAQDAEWLYEHRDEVMRDAGPEVEAEIANPLAIQIAVRFSKEEASDIRQAAADADLSVSEFIRNATRAAMNVPIPRGGLTDRVARLEQAVFAEKPSTEVN